MSQEGAKERSNSAPQRVSVNMLAVAAGIDLGNLRKNPEAKAALKSAQEYRKQAAKIKARLEAAQLKNSSLKKLGNRSFMDNVDEMLISPAAKLILEGEMANFKKKPRGRRWTLKQKVFYLAMYKKNRSTYLWYAKFLTVPCAKTLLDLLDEIPLEPGLCQPVLDHLSVQVQNKLKRKDKYCTLMFDEMAIQKGLYFNKRTGRVEGFEDFGKRGRTTRCANEALVFMLRGINSRWKMPIAYYFTRDTVTSEMLARLIPEVIMAAKEIGLTVLCSVSDQGSTNRGAISILRSKCEEGEYEPVYRVNEEMKVVHIFDIPHILKNIRNNLLTGDLHVCEGVVAKWQHLIDYYEYDQLQLGGKSGLRIEHVHPQGRTKMRVKFAIQPMGEKTCNKMEAVILASEGRKLAHCVPTILTFALIDLFFDLTNGHGMGDTKKPFRCLVNASSPHHLMWETMIKKLQSWKYVYNEGEMKGHSHRPPCLGGWIDDVKGFQRLWQTCENLGFKSLDLRRFNQDPVENLFSSIRQSNGSNRRPTSVQFTSALKTAVINNLSGSNIRNKNCTDDEDVLLSDLNSLFKNVVSEGGRDMHSSHEGDDPGSPELVRGVDKVYQDIEKFINQNKFSKLCRQHPTMVCNSIIDKVSKVKPFSECETCKSSLFTSEVSSDHLLTQASRSSFTERYADILISDRIQLPDVLSMVNHQTTSNNEEEEERSYVAPHIIKMFMSLRSKFLGNSFSYLNRNDVLQKLRGLCEKFDSNFGCVNHSEELVNTLVDIMSKTLLTITCQNFTKQLREKEKQDALKKKIGSASKSCNAHPVSLDNWDDLENIHDEWIDCEDDTGLDCGSKETSSMSTPLEDSAARMAHVTAPDVTAYFSLGKNLSLSFSNIACFISSRVNT